MTTPNDTFYSEIPVFRGFSRLMDPALYSPLPDDWSIGVADVVESTKAIAERRYKAVNMAGASVIAAITNALAGREFPFVFGGDGASFALSPNISYAMFSGGGLGWAETAMKRGEFAVPPAPSGTQPNLDGLSCRFEEIPSARGQILSVLVVPAPGADPLAFRK